METDLRGIEGALADIATALRNYANNATIGENSLQLFTGPEGSGSHPVLIALDPCSESTENLLSVCGRIATAFERIADALHSPDEAPPANGQPVAKS